MRIRKLGHSCVLLETAASRILIDPGVFSPEADTVTGLTDLLVTHAHPDHCDPQRIRRIVGRNPGVRVAGDRAVARTLRAEEVEVVQVTDGDLLEGPTPIAAIAGAHAVLHQELPSGTNVGWLIEDFFHPGDALVVPEQRVRVLALPIIAPWSKVAETIDYLRAVGPDCALPVHDAIGAPRDVWLGYIETLKPETTRIIGLESGVDLEV